MANRVLLIDKDMEFINLARAGLDRRGHDVEIALQGETGVEIVAHRRVDVVFLSTELPDLSSGEVLKRIMELKPGTLVIAAGTNPTKDRLFQTLEKGIVGYLEKPATEESFFVELGRALQSRYATV